MTTGVMMEHLQTAVVEKEEATTTDQPSAWMAYVIQAVLVLAAILISLTIYHFTVAERTAQKFALLDINEVIGIKQLVMADLALRKDVTDKDREGIYDAVAAFGKEMEVAVAQIQTECGCTLLVRNAVVKTSAAEDLTPLLKARLGLDRSISELSKSIRDARPTGGKAPGSAPIADPEQSK